MKDKMHKILRDGLLAILTLVLIVSVYISIDRAGSRSRDWRAGPICWVLHGHVDFASPPIMTVNLGSYREVIFFKHRTVVRGGGTYLVFGMNGALLFGSVAVLGALIGMVPVIGHRKPKKDKEYGDRQSALHASAFANTPSTSAKATADKTADRSLYRRGRLYAQYLHRNRDAPFHLKHLLFRLFL